VWRNARQIYLITIKFMLLYVSQDTPVFYHGGAMSWEPYYGEHDLDSMAAFAKDHISKPRCSAYREANCEEEQRKVLQTLKSMPLPEFNEMAAKAQAEFAELGRQFDIAKDELMSGNEIVVESFNAKVDEIVGSHNYRYIDQMLTKRTLEKALLGVDDGAEASS
jgi:hypothetical protein